VVNYKEDGKLLISNKKLKLLKSIGFLFTNTQDI
jgi:hypothetical protein